MTTRLKGLMVSLEFDIREDDAQTISNAILAIRGVDAVEPVEAGYDDWMNRERIRRELIGKIYDALEAKKAAQ